MNSDIAFRAFRKVPRTGVIYVMTEAKKCGWTQDDDDWVNFGQGQPDTSPLEGAPQRIQQLQLGDSTREYSSVDGSLELREAIASYYNQSYRKGRSSLYTADNVCISGGGRLGLTRIAAALGPMNLGHFLPDYTAYEELLTTFKSFTPIPILLDPKRNYSFSLDELNEEINGRGLGALLLSNPCNPTGKLLHGPELQAWVKTMREQHCVLILDEFYSRYIWTGNDPENGPAGVSAAEYVEDVNQDPILILDGLTKNWRYPGWRLSWTIGPKNVIESITSAGSFLDGGACHPIQTASAPLLDQKHYEQEFLALQQNFSKKRETLLSGLRKLGFPIEFEPQGSFYVWLNLEHLPQAIRGGMNFFEAALQHKVITVPGEFFDINPGKRRYGRPSRFRHFTRISFGPKMESIEKGLDRFSDMLKEYTYTGPA